MIKKSLTGYYTSSKAPPDPLEDISNGLVEITRKIVWKTLINRE
jgi:hypothetical protein